MDELERALAPALAEAGLELFDLEITAGLVRVTVDREGGVDLEGLSLGNRVVSRALDDLDPIPDRYTLEVTSPGLERPLRRPDHFRRALGSTVKVRTTEAVEGARRFTGTLAEAGDADVVLQGPEVPGGELRIPYAQVERARTVFEWRSEPERRRGTKRSPSTGRPRAADGPGRPHGDKVRSR